MNNQNQIPSLGDGGKIKTYIIKEERPLPSNRKEIISVFEDILNLGLVQKVVVEIGQPIKITRLSKEDLSVPENLKEEDAFANVRNAEIREFPREKDHSFHQYLFQAFSLITQERLRPISFLISNMSRLRQCLGVGMMWNLSEIFGVEVIKSEEIPDDVILLSASKHTGDEIVLSLRMLLG